MTHDDLKTTTSVVKKILETDEQSRNSDSFLYFKVLEFYGNRTGVDIHNMPVPHFLLNMSRLGVPPFESVRRTRQKVQAAYPWLASNKKVAEFRNANEQIYRAYALEE